MLMDVAGAIQRTPHHILSPCQMAFKVIWELEADVNNGGFHQYFFNSTGADAMAAIEALQSIGAAQCAALLTQALALVKPDTIEWNNRDQRIDLLTALNDGELEKLGALDDEFWRYPDDLSDLLTKFVQCNESEFPV